MSNFGISTFDYVIKPCLGLISIIGNENLKINAISVVFDKIEENMKL